MDGMRMLVSPDGMHTRILDWTRGPTNPKHEADAAITLLPLTSTTAWQPCRGRLRRVLGWVR